MKNKCLLFTTFLFSCIIGIFFFANISTVFNVFEGQEKPEVKKVISEINSKYPTDFSGKYTFINFNGLAQKLLGKNTMNGIVKMNNGYLTTMILETDTSVQVEYTKQFSEKLREEGIQFLYVQAPHIISKYDSELPVGISDYSNENADSYLSGLEEKGVNALDLRESFHERGLNQYDLFFRTDHHWKPEGAFIGFQEVARELERLLEVEIDDKYLDIENYKKDTYTDWFLGANAKRTGIYFGGVEDITVVYPDFPTNITLRVPAKEIYRQGDFQESVLDYSNLEEKDYFGKNPYHVYIGDEYPLVLMNNEDAPCKKKILLIKDSFALPVQAFLSECFTELDAIDLRLYSEGSVWEYVQETKPDAVVVLYNPYMLSTESLFHFMSE